MVAHETMIVPLEGDERTSFSRAFLANELEVPADLSPDRGIEYVSRWDVMSHLVNQGVIDWSTMKKQLSLAEGEE